MAVAVFHHIGEPSKDHMVNSIEQILGFDGQITFDGAYESVWDYSGFLRKKHTPILFVQGNTMGDDGVLTEVHIRTLGNLGFVIGWHGWSHRKLVELNDDEVRKELQKPDWITPVYAYPHGEFDERTKQLVKEAGYVRAYSTTQGNDDPFSLRREYV